jgi:hypothetical protein
VEHVKRLLAWPTIVLLMENVSLIMPIIVIVPDVERVIWLMQLNIAVIAVHVVQPDALADFMYMIVRVCRMNALVQKQLAAIIAAKSDRLGNALEVSWELRHHATVCLAIVREPIVAAV